MSSLLMIAAVTLPMAWEPVSRIRQTAETAVLAARPGATVVAQVDSNLHLTACAQTPLATVQGNGQTPSVMLSCGAPRPWTLYVPVQVQQRTAVAVLTQPVTAGQPVTAAMVQLQSRDVAALSSSYFSDAGVIIGSVARRSLAAGSVLSPADITAAPTVRRGQSVTIEYKSSVLQVSAAGLALNDAAPGQSVRVENSSSHRIVSGIVGADGRVMIGSR